MYLDNFVEIISGKLCNKPSIVSINNVVFNVLEVKHSDVFVARNKDDIPQAINRGAYAIVSDCYVDITDREIAWIVVENLQNAILKYIKYIKLSEGIEIFVCDNVTFHLAKSMINHIGFASDVYELLHSLHHKIIVINFSIMLFDIYNITHQENLHFRILRQTLFESTIEYENNIYHIIIPSIFVENINNVVHFCVTKHIKFHFNIHESLFLPIFINSFGKSVKYGQSMRFVYASCDIEMIEKYIQFVCKASWGKAMLLSSNILDSSIPMQLYHSNDDITQMLCDNNIHFFIIFGMELEELQSNLKDDFIEQNLF